MKPHVYEPSRMRNNGSDTKACCDQPEESHLPFVDGTTTTVVLTRDVRGLRRGTGLAKGTVIPATRSVGRYGMRQVSPARWGTNVLGQFAELEKAVYISDIPIPGWSIRIPGDKHTTGIPLRWAKEV